MTGSELIIDGGYTAQ
ncbi:MAG: hypothetical protein U5K27_21450 [Desulfotignum sp.]|nr:hypothetical protein [Desulfotignum sp.]